jgi:hypothetical protein
MAGMMSRAAPWLSHSVWFNRRHGRSGQLFQDAQIGGLQPGGMGAGIEPLRASEPLRATPPACGNGSRRLV